ncbi:MULTISPECIES: methionine synthase [Rhodococcus]|uniref:methionine synthase n=1 Tax=Rhodococcus TaxID=1827 RepID=UPI0007AE3BFC|nr:MULTISPECIES: methionine synthase [Rhodococcus]KZL30829.1 methionine synthase [Rhodococcus qingshengii]MBQ9055732.1 methionine synthase [Rhodococcus sp. (in: high G+C Gram-positive bacteria)]MCE4164643.1 methionine synthase [Rhodococcus sp. Ni2]
MTQQVSIGGLVTGIGSWPGTDARESAATILGELGGFPHLVELPSRGLGADMVGRAGAILVDINLDASTRAYRVVPRRGNVAKRAEDFLNQDLDALEEAWESARMVGEDHVVKLQVAGPLTLGAEIEVANGSRVLVDRGALRDIAESLGEGLARHAAEVTRRTGAAVVIQLDEPQIAAVLAGSLPGRTKMESVPALPEPEALAVLDSTISGCGLPTIVHSCGTDMPWDLLRRSQAFGVSFDMSLIGSRDLDGIGQLFDAGKELALGLVPSVEPEKPVTWKECAMPAVTLVDRLGFSRELLQTQVAVTPRCGLSGANLDWARAALRLCTDVGKALVDDPSAF